MPFVRAFSSASPARSSLLSTVLRVARYALVLALSAFCLSLLAIRFIVFPEIDRNRARVTNALSAQIGQPVEIDALVTGWNGWNPPLDMRGFRILDPKDRKPVLDLPQVTVTVAWTSVPFMELRLKELDR